MQVEDLRQKFGFGEGSSPGFTGLCRSYSSGLRAWGSGFKV